MHRPDGSARPLQIVPHPPKGNATLFSEALKLKWYSRNHDGRYPEDQSARAQQMIEYRIVIYAGTPTEAGIRNL